VDNLKLPMLLPDTEFTLIPPGQSVIELVKQITQLHDQILQVERQMLELLAPIVKLQAQPPADLLQPAPWKDTRDKQCDQNDS